MIAFCSFIAIANTTNNTIGMEGFVDKPVNRPLHSYVNCVDYRSLYDILKPEWHPQKIEQVVGRAYRRGNANHNSTFVYANAEKINVKVYTELEVTILNALKEVETYKFVKLEKKHLL